MESSGDGGKEQGAIDAGSRDRTRLCVSTWYLLHICNLKKNVETGTDQKGMRHYDMQQYRIQERALRTNIQTVALQLPQAEALGVILSARPASQSQVFIDGCLVQ